MKKTIDDLFERRCVNAYLAVDHNNRPMLYRRGDLYHLAKEAYDRGDKYFYACLERPGDLSSKIILSEPEYRWFIKGNDGLSDKDFSAIRNSFYNNNDICPPKSDN